MALLKAHAQPSSGDQRLIAARARWQKDHPTINSKIGLMLPDVDVWRADQLLDEGDMAGAETRPRRERAGQQVAFMNAHVDRR